MENKLREKILNQTSYWVEGVNGSLYDTIVKYMEANKLNRTKLANHLGISKGRVSQILNDGEINFSIEKIIEIALKVGKFPIFEFKDKQEYLQKETEDSLRQTLSINNFNSKKFFELCNSETEHESKIILLPPYYDKSLLDFSYGK